MGSAVCGSVREANASDAYQQAIVESGAWRDIWGCGQGIGVIDAVNPVAALIERLCLEYRATQALIAR